MGTKNGVKAIAFFRINVHLKISALKVVKIISNLFKIISNLF